MAASDYDRFSDGAHQAVVLTERVAREAGRGLAGPEDLLIALATVDPEARRVLGGAGTSVEALRERIEEWEGIPRPTVALAVDGPVEHARFSPSLSRAIHRAVRCCTQERSPMVTGRHLLRGLLDGEDEVVWRVLISVGVDPGPLANRPSLASRRESVAAAAERVRPRFGLRLPLVWR